MHNQALHRIEKATLRFAFSPCESDVMRKINIKTEI